MLLRAIENIRRKPKAARQQYAFVTAVTFTAIVAGVWSLSLPARFVAVQEGVAIATPEVSSQKASVPFSGVWTEFKQQVLGLVGQEAASEVNNEPLLLISTSTAVTATTSAEVQEDPLLLESGSTIRFGTQPSASSSSTIMLGTTSTTSSTSPDGL